MGEQRYLLDGRALGGDSGVRGIGTYARELLAALAGLGVAGRIELLGGWHEPAPPEVARLGLRCGPSLPRVPRIQPLLDPLLVALAVRRSRPSLYHGLEWGQPAVALGVPVVITVQDLIPWVLPHRYRLERRRFAVAMRQLRFADAIVTPSQATARDVSRIAGVDAERVTVIPHGVAAVFSPPAPSVVDETRRRLGITRPYILSAGTLDPRKRPEVLASLTAEVRRRHDVELVITGEQGVYAPQVRAAVARRGLEPHTRLLGHVATVDLACLYAAAGCVVIASEYEGFGLPLLEALACGGPVVAFDGSSLAEAGGDGAVLIPDGDTAALTAAVLRVLDDTPDERSARVARGRAWASPFTWERSARSHLALYERLSLRSR